MTNRALAILAVIAAVLSALSYVAAGDRPTVEFEFVAGRNLIPDIDTARVHEIEVEGWGKKTKLLRQGDGFVVVSRNNYPADSKALSDLVRACLKVRCDEEITTSRTRHADLNVNWPSGRAHRVRFFDAASRELVGLIVSNVLEGKVQGNHVRLTDSDTVYRTDNNIVIKSDPLKYLFRKLVPVAAKEITRVDVKHDEHFAIEQDAEGNFELQGVPDGMQPMGRSFVNILVQVPQFEFDDFVPFAEKRSLRFSKTFEVAMQAKIRYILGVAQEGKTFWVVAKAEYFGPSGIGPDASVEQIREVARYAQASADAQAYNRQHAGHVYKVHERFGFYLTHPLAPLIESKGK